VCATCWGGDDASGSSSDLLLDSIAPDAAAGSARTIAELLDYFEQLRGWPQHYRLLLALYEQQPDTPLLIVGRARV
jgi:hypothetical protein